MMGPRFLLEPELVAHLAPLGAAVTIRTTPRHGCCGGTVAVPVAEAGAPRDVTSFDLTEQEGVRIYVERGLLAAAPGPITVGLDGVGRWRRLWVGGLEARL
jgi:hypothetical protein